MRTLTFNKNFGSFKQGETYDIENNLTANYFVQNNIASEEIENVGCKDCQPKDEEVVVEIEETVTTTEEEVVVEEKVKQAKPKK